MNKRNNMKMNMMSMVVVVLMISFGAAEEEMDVIAMKRQLAEIAFNRTKPRVAANGDLLKDNFWDFLSFAEPADFCDPLYIQLFCPNSPNGCPPTGSKVVSTLPAGFCECGDDGVANLPTTTGWVTIGDSAAYLCSRLTGSLNFFRGKNGGKIGSNSNSGDGRRGVRATFDQDWFPSCRKTCTYYCNEAPFICFVINLDDDDGDDRRGGGGKNRIDDGNVEVRDSIQVSGFCVCGCTGSDGVGDKIRKTGSKKSK